MRTLMWGMALTLTLTLAAQSPASVPELRESRMLVLVMPEGAWRLTVIRSGAARISHGGLPQAVWAPPGAISFPGFHADLKERVLAEPCARAEEGRVEFITAESSGTTAIWCMPDDAFAVERFEQVWARVPEPTDRVGLEHYDFLRAMWDRRDGPIGPRP